MMVALFVRRWDGGTDRLAPSFPLGPYGFLLCQLCANPILKPVGTGSPPQAHTETSVLLEAL